MAAAVWVGRLCKNGSGTGLALSPEILQEMRWGRNDRVAIRRHQNTLIIERIPLEQLALLRRPAEAQDGQ